MLLQNSVWRVTFLDQESSINQKMIKSWKKQKFKISFALWSQEQNRLYRPLSNIKDFSFLIKSKMWTNKNYVTFWLFAKEKKIFIKTIIFLKKVAFRCIQQITLLTMLFIWQGVVRRNFTWSKVSFFSWSKVSFSLEQIFWDFSLDRKFQ
jgi:hypothetical protein